MSGAAWGYAGSIAMLVLTIGAQAVLARIIGPADFGVFAVGILVVSFAGYLADFGIGSALVAKKDLTDEDIRFAFTVQLLIGVVLAAAMYLSAGLVSRLIDIPESKPVVQLLSLVILLMSTFAISGSLLHRDFGFRHQSIAQVIGYLVGNFAIAVPLALSGFGAMSMAIGWVAQAVVGGLYVWRYYPHPVRPLLHYPQGRGLLRFGGLSTVALIARYFANSIARAIVGRLTAAAHLAFYATSITLASHPVGRLLGTLQGVAFSYSSRLNDDDAGGAQPLLATIEVSTLIFAPLYLVMAAVADTLILTLYGPGWEPAGAVIRAAAIAMLAMSFTEISSPFLWGFGRGRADTLGHILTAILVVVLTYVGTHYSIAATAWLMAGAYAARSIFLTVMAARYLRVQRHSDLLRALRPGMLLAIPPALACGSLDWLMAHEGLVPWLRLVIVGLVATVVTVTAFLAMRGLLSSPLRSRLESLLPRLAAARG